MATIKYGTLDLVPAPELGYSVESRFFGADIRFSQRKTYSLKSSLLSTSTSGVSGIYTQQEQIVTGFANDYQPFYINGIVIGYPQVKSISFEQGTLVQTDKYNIELEILESGNPFQVSGTYYNLTGTSGLFYNIENVVETLEYFNDFKTFNYDHNVEVTYRTGNSINPLLNAKLIASGLLNNESVFPFVVTGGASGKRIYEERQDDFAGVYSVNQHFIGTTGNQLYDHNYSLKIQTDSNGVTTVTQLGVVKGVVDDRYTNAKSGYAIVKNGIYANCSGIYQTYGGAYSLNSSYLTDSRTDEINNGVISYNRSFSDETGISNVRWKYTEEIKIDNNIFQANEVGTIEGLGHISTRFSQASGFFNTIEPTIKTRVLEQFSGAGASGTLFENERERSFNRFEGIISYNYGYSNDPGLGVGSGIYYVDTTIEDNLPMANRVNYDVVNVGVLVQPLVSTKEGQRLIRVNAQGYRNTAQTTVFTFAHHKINQYRPVTSEFLDPFLDTLSLSYNPAQNQLNVEANYIYGGQKADTSLFI